MKMKLLRGYFRAKGLLEDFAKEERAGPRSSPSF